MNETISHVKGTKHLSMKYQKLHTDNFKIYVFVDNGYNTNQDATTQLGTIVYLVDKDKHCKIIHWSSNEFPRITRSKKRARNTRYHTDMTIELV